MIYPDLAPIDWAALVGGDADASAAITARDRKLAAVAKLCAEIEPMARRLEISGATFVCSPAVLTSEPYAARWYLDLAGLTSKLISKLRPSFRAAGLTITPETIATNLYQGRAVAAAQLERFSAWVNDLLLELYPTGSQTAALAYCTAVAMAGARIDGQVRNMSGDDAVLTLKKLLVGAFSTRGCTIETQAKAGDPWAVLDAATDLMEQQWLRFGGRVVCEFVAGGNRPDIKVTIDGVVVLLGEVKGRTDLSNVWESWMPQINGHLQTWAAENSMAPRVFFGTIITQQMIDGLTPGGTRHTGLRAFSNSGLLRAAYNLTNVVEGEEASVKAFDDLVDQLARNL